MSDYYRKPDGMWQDWLTLIIGVWLFFSVWLLGFSGIAFAMWNALVFGVLIAAAALLAITRFQWWEEWVDMAIGAWLIVSPWVLGFASLGGGDPIGATVATWNFVGVGAATFLLSAWSLYDHGGTSAA